MQDCEKLVAFLTPALIGVGLIFKTGCIRASVKGPAENGPIRYFKEKNFLGKKILRISRFWLNSRNRFLL